MELNATCQGDIVLDGDSAPPTETDTAAPNVTGEQDRQDNGTVM